VPSTPDADNRKSRRSKPLPWPGFSSSFIAHL
jgi:hypothetical protein